VTFVDTSALLAFLDRDAARHEDVVEGSRPLLGERRAITHNYILVESAALALRRLGAGVARHLLEDIAPVLQVIWVDADLHNAAVAAHIRSLRRRASLVDHVSFELMRRRGVRQALALDDDFRREGFELVPAA
jgi:predicted nucleic acid-binding protein